MKNCHTSTFGHEVFFPFCSRWYNMTAIAHDKTGMREKDFCSPTVNPENDMRIFKIYEKRPTASRPSRRATKALNMKTYKYSTH